MKRKQIKIPEPIADVGDIVEVRNYRIKNKCVWEEGRIRSVKYERGFVDWHWSYDIRLTRKSKQGNFISLYVGDDSISLPLD